MMKRNEMAAIIRIFAAQVFAHERGVHVAASGVLA